MKIQEMIAAVQTALNIDSDGRAGPQTWEAIHKHVVGPVPVAADALVISTVDPRSEKCIATLLPEVRPFARALVQNAAAAGITIKIISGLRTYEEQNQLYAQGRTVIPPTIALPTPRADSPTIISASPSTSACLKKASTSATRPSTQQLAYLARNWAWTGAANGRRSKTCRTSSCDPPGPWKCRSGRCSPTFASASRLIRNYLSELRPRIPAKRPCPRTCRS